MSTNRSTPISSISEISLLDDSQPEPDSPSAMSDASALSRANTPIPKKTFTTLTGRPSPLKLNFHEYTKPYTHSVIPASTATPNDFFLKQIPDLYAAIIQIRQKTLQKASSNFFKRDDKVIAKIKNLLIEFFKNPRCDIPLNFHQDFEDFSMLLLDVIMVADNWDDTYFPHVRIEHCYSIYHYTIFSAAWRILAENKKAIIEIRYQLTLMTDQTLNQDTMMFVETQLRQQNIARCAIYIENNKSVDKNFCQQLSIVIENCIKHHVSCDLFISNQCTENESIACLNTSIQQLNSDLVTINHLSNKRVLHEEVNEKAQPLLPKTINLFKSIKKPTPKTFTFSTLETTAAKLSIITKSKSKKQLQIEIEGYKKHYLDQADHVFFKENQYNLKTIADVVECNDKIRLHEHLIALGLDPQKRTQVENNILLIKQRTIISSLAPQLGIRLRGDFYLHNKAKHIWLAIRNKIFENLDIGASCGIIDDAAAAAQFSLPEQAKIAICVEELLHQTPRHQMPAAPDIPSSLLFCVYTNNFIASKQLLDANADANQAGKLTGITPLYLAARNGSVAMVRLLLQKEYKADINKPRYGDGLTALHIATVNAHLEVVNLLLQPEYHVDVNKTDHNGSSPLYTASYMGDTVQINLLLQHGADLTLARIEFGSTALYIAAEKGHVKAVELLLEQKADPNQARTHDGNTPLHIAAEKGHLSIVKLLLQPTYKAKIDEVRTDTKATPLFIAIQNDYPDIVECLLKAGAKITIASPITLSYLRAIAIKHLRQEELETLLKPHPERSVSELQYVTLLHMAALLGNIEIVQQLLAANAAKDEVTSLGFTALDFAEVMAHEEIVKLLTQSNTKKLKPLSHHPS